MSDEKKGAEAEELIFEQLLCGREYGMLDQIQDPMMKMVLGFGVGMKNFSYIIGEKSTKDCVLVDPAWDPSGILSHVKKLGFKIVGIILTHGHFDHCGGEPPPPYNAFGIMVPGVKEILKSTPVKVYGHTDEIPLLMSTTHLKRTDFTPVDEKTTLKVGRTIELKFLHTPGHTDGSMCIMIEDGKHLLTGDTLFCGSCGRMDLCKNGPLRMWSSLQKLATLPQEYTVWPGHAYGPNKTTIRREISNGLLKKISKDDWMKQHGAKAE